MNDPVYMLNALWFKERGGLEKYLQYRDAVLPLLKEAGAEVLPSYHPEEGVIGEWDPDVFFVVRYPSKAAFDTMIASSGFRDIAHLREEALERSLLIRCSPFDWSLNNQ